LTFARAMQGGASEELVRLRKVGEALDACNKQGNPSKRNRDELVRPPLDTLKVEDEILISPSADAMLMKAREMFALSIAVPIAWLHLDASVEESRRRKHERVRQGAANVLRLQQMCRHAIFDYYFQIWAFFAEEEFYLIVEPIFFWCVDYRLARQMNWIVCGGLLWGNLLKDVFQLPRPAKVEPKVWVPHSSTQVDSTACRDFGFPSTHAMNSVSNSLFTVLYYLEYHGSDATISTYLIMFVCMLIWIFSISFGRLYLGVHSPMDVKGGLIMGTVLALVARLCVKLLDRCLLEMPYGGVALTLCFTVVLLLNPQPRPMTPTFMQNCTVSGLLLGAALGFRMETDRRQGRVDGADIGLTLLILRTILGYVIVIVARMVMKRGLVFFFRQVGFEPNPAKPVKRTDSKELHQEIKGWDLWAAAVVKTTLYASLAWTITCGVPIIFELLGVSCAMNG